VKRIPIWLLAIQVLFVGAFWFHGELFIAHNGPTFDEAVHLTAGHSYWTTGQFRMNVEDPPVPKLLWALPGVLAERDRFQPDPLAWERNDQWRMGNDFLFGEAGRMERLLAPARRMNMIFGVGVVLLVGWWGRRLWDSPLAGLIASQLAAFDPTLVAMSAILSTDAALTFFTFLSAYLIWEYAAKPSNWLMIAIGISIGLALGSKFSAVFALIGLAVGVFVYLLTGGSFGATTINLRARLASALTPTVRITIMALITLAAGYFFVHFPEWGRGFKVQLTRAEHGDPHYFFLGDVRSTGTLWYFLVAIPLKLPIGSLVLFAMAVIVPRAPSPLAPLPPGERGTRMWPLVVLPPLVFLTLITISGVNLGIRVALPVLPYIWLTVGRFIVVGQYRILRLIITAICLLSMTQAWAKYTHYPLSFFNDAVGGPEQAVKLLGDSNLDWGQGLPAIRNWMQREGVPHIYLGMHGEAPPEYFGIRHQRLPGYQILERPPVDHVPANAPRHILMVSATHLQGIYLKPDERLDWLAGRQPIAILAASVWVYDITNDAEARARLAIK